MRPRDPAWRLSAAAFLLAATIIPPAAADKPCSPADMASAEKAIDNVTSWAALDRAVRDFGHCDRGRAAELFTEALLRVVIDGWPKIGEAEPFLGPDSPFREWTTRHLSSSALSKEDSESVRGLAKSSCPAGRAQLCEYFREALEFGKPLVMPTPIEIAKPPAPTGKK